MLLNRKHSQAEFLQFSAKGPRENNTSRAFIWVSRCENDPRERSSCAAVVHRLCSGNYAIFPSGFTCLFVYWSLLELFKLKFWWKESSCLNIILGNPEKAPREQLQGFMKIYFNRIYFHCVFHFSLYSALVRRKLI